MPANNNTTKSAKRTTSTKKRGLLSKINFSSKKTQFIAVIAIVAVLGGGWFTYRSFALSNSGTVGAASLDRTPVTETKGSTGKSGQKVARLAPGESIYWVGTQAKLANFNSNGTYRFCATVRYENPSSSSKPSQVKVRVERDWGINTTNDMGVFGLRLVVDDIRYALEADKYTKQCTRTFRGWGIDEMRVYLKNNGPSTVRSGTFIIERL